jgi:hypothetical protein
MSFEFLNNTPDNTYSEKHLTTYLNTFQEKNEFRDIFFSSNNVNNIQKKIRDQISLKTNGKIRLRCNQDVKDILSVMSYVYGDEKKYNIVYLSLLNRKVVNMIVPNMITNIKQYIQFRNDQNADMMPIDHPIHSTSFDKTLTHP